ncbi:MAG: T9SS type A sorting domain-containing protein [Chitinophagaceae bacterium]
MNKKNILFLILLFSQQLLSAQMYFQWAKQSSNAVGLVDAFATVYDANDNVYVASIFNQTTDFDPSSGTFNLSPVQAGYYDIAITKFSSNGTFIWAKKLGGFYDDYASDMTIDQNNNLIICGYFFGTSDFDPGVGVANLVASANDAFVCKLNSDGDYLWAKSFGAGADDIANNIKIDASNNIYVGGNFGNTVDFNPGAAVNSFTSVGNSDAFVLKLSDAGAYVWARTTGSIDAENVFSLFVDNSSNVFVVGTYENTMDLDPGASILTVINEGTKNSFIQKFDINGNLIYGKVIHGFNNVEANSIVADASGNAFIVGGFSGTADFDVDAPTNYLTSAGSNDQFILKLSSSGSTVFANRLGSASSDRINKVIIDNVGSIYTSGTFSGTIDFDPSTNTNNLISTGSTDAFMAKYDNNGNYLNAISFGGTSIDLLRDMKLSSSGLIYGTGRFQGTSDFDPTSGVFTLSTTSPSIAGMFLVKFSLNAVTPLEFLNLKAEQVNTANLISWETQHEINTSYFEVENSIDGIYFESIGFVKSNDQYDLINTYSLNHQQPLLGINYYRIKQVDIDGQYTYSSICSVKNSSIESASLTLYPNPAKSYIKTNYQLYQEAKITIEIRTPQGNLVQKREISLESGSHTLELNTAHLPNGTYILSITNQKLNTTNSATFNIFN